MSRLFKVFNPNEITSEEEGLESFSTLEKIFDRSKENLLILNPKFTSEEKNDLYDLANQFTQQYFKNGFFFISSSGSSQRKEDSPKLIAISSDSLIKAAHEANQFLGLSLTDRWGLTLPWYHIGGFSILARSYALKKAFKGIPFEKNNLLDSFVSPICDSQVSVISLVPAQVNELIQQRTICPAGLKKVVLGTGQLDENLSQAFKTLGYVCIETFGMTETLAMFAYRVDHLTNSYQVLPHVKISSDPETSRLRVKSPYLAHSVWQKRQAQIHHDLIDLQKGYLSQDQVQIDSVYPNRFTFLGRQDELVKIKGYGVSLPSLRQKLDELMSGFQIPASEGTVIYHEAQIHLIFSKAVSESQTRMLIDKFNQVVRPYEKAMGGYWLSQIPRTQLGKIQWGLVSEQLSPSTRILL